MTLQKQLIASGKNRWLDVGNGGRFDKGFEYLDVFPEGFIPAAHRALYHRLDVINATDHKIDELGKFDLVRLQHVLEHFSFEDGHRALVNVGRLLRRGGHLLITVPDLRRHLSEYQSSGYRDWDGFKAWAHLRIPEDAPASAYFSVFAHSMTFEPHKWCYDYEGLEYQVRRAGVFGSIRELALGDPLAGVPFTHNRPDEDVCLLTVHS